MRAAAREGWRATPNGVGRSHGFRRMGAIVATAALTLAVLPGIAGGETVPAPVSIMGRCTGTTEAGQAAINSIGLGGFGIDATVTLPEQTPLGEPAVADMALSFDLSESLASLAGTFDVDSVDLSGTTFEVTLLTPDGPITNTVTPPSLVVDADTVATIDLGATQFDIPTGAPGVIQVVVGGANLAFATSPAGFGGDGTCVAASPIDMPVGFVVDPLAPVIDPALRMITVTDMTGSQDLNRDVTAGPGPVVADSWRVVRNTGSGIASMDDDSAISYELDGAGLDSVWEVCGLSTAPTTTTTTTTPSGSDDGEGEPQVAAAEPSPEGNTAESPDPADTEEPTRHCAQGMLAIRDGNEPVAEVKGTSLEPGSDQPTAAPTAASAAAAAPISVTG